MCTESTKFVSWAHLGLLTILITAIGCWTSSPRQVVVYTALDREFSEPIFRDFTDQTGIIVLPKYDTESTKTVGLTNGIIAEKARPRCDVFWNNEILNTLRLEQLGLIQAYVSPHANDFPENFRSEQGNWYGFAARARVLIVNTLGYVAGWYLAKLYRFDYPHRLTLTIEIGMQNAGLGVALALAHFTPETALPGALFAVWCVLTASGASAFLRRYSV